MHRRALLLSTLLPWCAPARAAAPDAPRPRLKVSAGRLYEALATRFPLQLGIAGLLALQVSAPRLLLLPARNRLGATLLAQAAGPAVQPLAPGELDLSFRLRYVAADRSLRAHDPELLDLRLPGLPPEGVQALQGLVPQLARQGLGEVVLHTFSARELALPDTMGFAPETLTVLEDGVLVVFGPARQGMPR